MSSADDIFGAVQVDGPQEAEDWESDARGLLEAMFDRDRERVFFSRQVEVVHEGRFFHWVTSRAPKTLVANGVINSEERDLSNGGRVTLMWHRSYRYYKRAAERVVALIDEYAAPNIGAALGLQGEAIILEGFARQQFVMTGRSTRRFGGSVWTASEHDLDFIFEGDGIAYGVEVKNTLGYMGHDELELKSEMCRQLGLRPVFAARMLPKSWIHEVASQGGFCLIFKYQLYPWSQRDLARRVREELGLPVDSPRALEQGTMERFLGWHREQVSR